MPSPMQEHSKMSNIHVANAFFAAYKSACPAPDEAGRKTAYQEMHELLSQDTKFKDYAFPEGIQGDRVRAMWQLFCTRQPKPVEVDFDPAQTAEENGKVIVRYNAKYLLPAEKEGRPGKPIDYWITANLTIVDGKIVEQEDDGDMQTWAKQAKGIVGQLFWWAGFFKKKVNKKISDRLDAFMIEESKRPQPTVG